MYHLRLKGNHYEMGVKRGKIFNKSHIAFPLQLDDFQLEHGKQSEEILRKLFPEVCEEIRGVSDTIGADYLHFASWMLCMGCCMYNLKITSLLRFGAVRLLPIPKMADWYMAETMTCRPICVMDVKVKFTHRGMETDFISLHPLSSTGKRD